MRDQPGAYHIAGPAIKLPAPVFAHSMWRTKSRVLLINILSAVSTDVKESDHKGDDGNGSDNEVYYDAKSPSRIAASPARRYTKPFVSPQINYADRLTSDRYARPPAVYHCLSAI